MKYTHGFEGVSEDDDAIRSQAIAMDTEGNYNIKLTTQWRDSPVPVITQFNVTKRALTILHELTGEALTRMHEYEILK